jgi:hypothetical protein
VQCAARWRSSAAQQWSCGHVVMWCSAAMELQWRWRAATASPHPCRAAVCYSCPLPPCPGTLTATNGPADGMTSVDIGVSQSSAEDGRTLQRTGTGSTRDAFSWTGPTASSFGTVNPGQSFVSPTAVPSAAPTNVPSTMPTATPSDAPSAAPEAHCPDFCTAGGRSVLFGVGTIVMEGIECNGCAPAARV